jgi:pyroglutamyl-peptidase
VVHFGLNGGAEAIAVETLARRRCSPDKPDVAGYAPPSGQARRSGPDILRATLPAPRVARALEAAGFPARLSDDAGDYVCNATLYRSLLVAPRGRMVGFVHVPAEGTNGVTAAGLHGAARIVLAEAVAAWRAPRAGD